MVFLAFSSSQGMMWCRRISRFASKIRQNALAAGLCPGPRTRWGSFPRIVGWRENQTSHTPSRPHGPPRPFQASSARAVSHFSASLAPQLSALQHAVPVAKFSFPNDMSNDAKVSQTHNNGCWTCRLGKKICVPVIKSRRLMAAYYNLVTVYVTVYV